MVILWCVAIWLIVLLLYVVTALVFLVFMVLFIACWLRLLWRVGDWFGLISVMVTVWVLVGFYDCLVLVRAVFLWLRLICGVWLFTVSC